MARTPVRSTSSFPSSLADALGYTPIMDPALELFAGEHVHLASPATTAEAAFYITVQGVDFDDEAWSFQLMGADGTMLYADGSMPPPRARRWPCAWPW